MYAWHTWCLCFEGAVELPSQLAVDLADTPTHRGDLSVEQFRDNVRTLSLRRGTQRQSSRRQPLRERIRPQQLASSTKVLQLGIMVHIVMPTDLTGTVMFHGCSVVENIKI